MADEILSRDQNRVTVLAGVTDDANLEIRMLRVDPVSKRLLISATALGFGLTVGTTTITSGTTTRILYNNAGVLGEYTISGSGTAVAMATDPTFTGVVTIPNVGLHLLDTNASHDLIIKPGSDLTADRTLTITTGDTDMIVNLTATTDEYVLGYDVTTNTWRGIAVAAGVGDMVLASVQSVTGLKTFDTTKLAVKGSSTGSTAIASANAGGTDYTQTLQARTGTIANLDNTFYIGTTEVALNRASAALTLAGLTLTTPDIGVATATSVNKMAITAPATASTLAVADGKTFTVSNTLTLTATDSATLAIGGGGTLGTGAYATIANYAPLASPSFTGTITISDNTRFDLTLPTADTYCTGNTTDSFNSGYSSAIGDLVFFGSGGKWLEVDSDAVATCKGLMGIALEAKTDGQAMKVALPGSMVRLDAWNWTVGDTLYAGETLGALQNTIPTGPDAIIKVVAFALNADTIYFNPSPDQQSTVA